MNWSGKRRERNFVNEGKEINLGREGDSGKNRRVRKRKKKGKKVKRKAKERKKEKGKIAEKINFHLSWFQGSVQYSHNCASTL